MCINDEYITKTAEYISFMLDENTSLTPISRRMKKEIPIFITQSFTLYKGNILGKEVIFAFTANGNTIPPVQTMTILDLLERKCACNAILVTSEVASYNIARLVAKRVNFIVPQKQMFLPSFLMELRETKTLNNDEKKIMPAIAQCLLLYHIQIAPLNKKNMSELGSLFEVSYATVNRAVRWLKEKGLITLEGTKTKEISFLLSNKELWESALPWLCSPIEKVIYTDSTINDAKECGINALSEYTMLNCENSLSYALSNNELKALYQTTDKDYGENKIEVWRYSPKFLSKGRYVDKLSLYLSLKDNEDERIQIELENLMSSIRW